LHIALLRVFGFWLEVLQEIYLLPRLLRPLFLDPILCCLVDCQKNLGLIVLHKSPYARLLVRVVIYYGHVYPHLNYGILLWGNHSSAKSLFILQKRAIRIIHGAPPRTHCEQLFIKLGILTSPSITSLRYVQRESQGCIVGTLVIFLALDGDCLGFAAVFFFSTPFFAAATFCFGDLGAAFLAFAPADCFFSLAPNALPPWAGAEAAAFSGFAADASLKEPEAPFPLVCTSSPEATADLRYFLMKGANFSGSTLIVMDLTDGDFYQDVNTSELVHRLDTREVKIEASGGTLQSRATKVGLRPPRERFHLLQVRPVPSQGLALGPRGAKRRQGVSLFHNVTTRKEGRGSQILDRSLLSLAVFQTELATVDLVAPSLQHYYPLD
ncbi:hypothetical protein C0J52_26089, partial [Blattella germanica]